jgi:uncharacterized protein YggT (Ycf19 family)
LQFNVVLEVIRQTACVLLSAIHLAMTLRAILSWFPFDNKFTQFLDVVTEPVVYPMRKLFEKMNWFQGIPLDMSFMASFMIITIFIIILG